MLQAGVVLFCDHGLMWGHHRQFHTNSQKSSRNVLLIEHSREFQYSSCIPRSTIRMFLNISDQVQWNACFQIYGGNASPCTEPHWFIPPVELPDFQVYLAAATSPPISMSYSQKITPSQHQHLCQLCTISTNSHLGSYCCCCSCCIDRSVVRPLVRSSFLCRLFVPWVRLPTNHKPHRPNKRGPGLAHQLTNQPIKFDRPARQFGNAQ